MGHARQARNHWGVHWMRRDTLNPRLHIRSVNWMRLNPMKTALAPGAWIDGGYLDVQEA